MDDDELDRKYEETKRKLAVEVREQFTNWKNPFLTSESLLAELDDDELKPLGPKLLSKGWDPLDETSVREMNGFVFPLMSAKLFTYLIPAHLLYLLTSPKAGGEDVYSFIDYIGHPAPKGQPITIRLARGMLDAGQVDVLKDFLKLYEENWCDHSRFKRRIGRIIESIDSWRK